MNRYIRKCVVGGLCFATVTFCMPAQVTFAANAGESSIMAGALSAANTADEAEPDGVEGAVGADETTPVDEITVMDDAVTRAAKLKAPVLTAESVGYNSAELVWNAVETAASYELQQSADKKNYTALVTVKTGQELRYHAQELYTGQKTFFRVIAKNASGGTAASAWLKVKPVLSSPTVTKMKPSANNAIDLEWTAVEGADFYRVRRSTTETGGYATVKKVYGTSYTDTVTSGVTYYYKIMPVRLNPDKKKVKGKCSAPQSVKAQADKPVVTQVTNSADNSLTVEWSGVENAGGYAVYRSLTKSGGYKCLAEVGSDTFVWMDTTVEAGTKYFYKVSAYQTVDGVKKYGTRSGAKAKWTVPDAPENLSVTLDGSGGVRLSWTETKGATSYTIYRAQENGGYAQIATKVTGNSYTDRGLTAGASYSYQIAAVNGSLVSERSGEATIKIGAIKVNTRTLFLGPDVSKKLTAESELSGTITWSSKDPSIAKVNADGKVTGVAPGKTVVTADIGGATAQVNVTVTDCKTNGIDVSKWQQAIDWKTVKASGIEFAMLRLTYGTSVDIQFENYYKGAREQGIDVGVYCYTRAKNVKEGIAEAENLVKLLDGRTLEYPVALDLEDELQIKNMNKAARTELILEYKRIIEEAGYEFVVYANLNWLNTYIDQTKLEEENVDIWIARYRSQSLGHGYNGGGNVTMWQYSSTGQIDGILDAYGRYINVDLDVCYEDY